MRENKYLQRDETQERSDPSGVNSENDAYRGEPPNTSKRRSDRHDGSSNGRPPVTDNISQDLLTDTRCTKKYYTNEKHLTTLRQS